MGSSGSMGTGMGISMSAGMCIGWYGGGGGDAIANGVFWGYWLYYEVMRIWNYGYILGLGLGLGWFGIGHIWFSGVGMGMGMGMVYGTSRMIPFG